jgi:glutaminyl-tRNA synthetase
MPRMSDPNRHAEPDVAAETPDRPLNFIEQQVAADLDAGRYPRVVTRFPPEPNGFLHIGHAKAICIDFGTARRYHGDTNLRMDDTNPAREEQLYIDAIREDVEWLGYSWTNFRHASDYFDQLYDWAETLVNHGHAYVDDQSADEIRRTRGTLTEPGTPSPCRERSPEENLDLLRRMKAGEFENGAKVLRAKIDMASPNVVLRDPTMYRILHAPHPRTGDKWCIYPMYDWAHGQSDWIEGVTHSLCDTSFEIHRPLYEWFIDRLAECGAYPEGVDYKSRQIEFARGNITYLVTSKRKLLQLVQNGIVTGWDDPRMPTIRGMRRRGYTPEAIRRFWDEVGVQKRENNVEFAKLENVLRSDLNQRALRRMAVLDPLKLTITNLPDDHVDRLEAVNNPEDESAGSRKVDFCNTLYIEREDFMEDPPKKFFRLAPGKEVRLRYAYLFTCHEVVKDDTGNVVEVRGEIDPDSRGGNAPDGRKVKGTIHWASARHAISAEVRLYEHLFTAEDPTRIKEVSAGADDPNEAGTIGGGDDAWLVNVNHDSLTVNTEAKLEPALADDPVGTPLQFERLGYFIKDPDSTATSPVFNRTITLRDTWAKIAKKA